MPLLRRAPSTITRELARFAAWPDGPAAVASTPAQYDARAAGLRVRRARSKCRRRSKLATDTVLFGMVQHLLAQAWSPSQIAGTLKLMWPDEPQRTVSHESIYTCTYAMPKGELRKDLIACLRRAKSKRMPRSRGEDRRGQMPDLLSIHVSMCARPRPVTVPSPATGRAISSRARAAARPWACWSSAALAWGC